MTLDSFLNILTVLTPIFTICSLIYVVKNSKRTDKKDLEERVETMSEIKVKLDMVLGSVNELKADIKDNKNCVADLEAKLRAVEESVKSAHHRIDELKSKE